MKKLKKSYKPKEANFEDLGASVIIPNYNGGQLIRKHLPEVIRAKKNSKNKIIEIIIVDDASTDESISLIKKEFPEIRLIKHKINRGFSSSINTGARSAKGELMVLLNSDVSPTSGFMEPVFKHFKDPRVFAVSLNESGFSWARGKFEDGFIAHQLGEKTDRYHHTFWVSGGSGVFRRDIWMKLGGMDEHLLSPYYWEDLDISYRAQKRGYLVFWEPKAKVIHEHESTMQKLDQKKVNRIKERNHLLFIWKNLTSPNLSRKHVAGLFKRMARHPGYIRIVLMALTRIKKVLKARKKELKETRVSDEAIFSRF